MDDIKNAYNHGETVDDETRLITFAQHPKLEEYRNRAKRDVEIIRNDNGRVSEVHLRALDKTFLGVFSTKLAEEAWAKQVLMWLREVDSAGATGVGAGVRSYPVLCTREAPIGKNTSSSPASGIAQEAAAAVVGTSLSRYSTGGRGDHLAEGASHLALVTRDEDRISVPPVKASKSPSSGAGSSSDLAAHLSGVER